MSPAVTEVSEVEEILFQDGTLEADVALLALDELVDAPLFQSLGAGSLNGEPASPSGWDSLAVPRRSARCVSAQSPASYRP